MDQRRYYGLDALRGVMMLLGIVIHAAMFYTVQDSEVVPFKDRHTSAVFDLISYFIHSFRMPAFFLLSGFFGALLVEKYGMKRAYWNRVERIFVPFVIGMVTVLPPTAWMLLSFIVSTDEGTRVMFTMAPSQVDAIDRLVPRPSEPSPGHLWFLYYLMMLYALMPLCILGRRLVMQRGWSARAKRVTASPWLPVQLAAATALTLWPYRGGIVEGFQFLRPHLPSLVYYAVFFVTGYFLQGFRDFLTTSERYAGVYLATAALVFIAAIGPTSLAYQGRETAIWLHLVVIGLNALLTWLLVYAAIGFFQRFLDRDSPWVVYIAHSSYWVYIVHVPIVSFAAWMLVDVDVPAVVKFALAGAFTTVVAFASYHYLVRRTFISVMLNGRRFSQGWPWGERKGRVYRVGITPGDIAP